MAYKNMHLHHRRLAKERRANQSNRDMIDAIREMLGMRPLFCDEKSRNYAYNSGAMRVHEDIAPIRITLG